MTMVHKFGHSDAIGTSMTPITSLGVYRTPQIAGATKLRVKAGDAGDAPAGAGAWRIGLEGIADDGCKVKQFIPTNGVSPGAASVSDFIRLYRIWVDQCGTYASPGVGSHVAPIVIENEAGTEDWGTIENHNGYPEGQSEIAAFTSCNRFKIRVHGFFAQVSGNKAATVLFAQRRKILQTATPYTAWRTIQLFPTVPAGGEVFYEPKRELIIPDSTDLVAMAETATGTAEVAAQMELELLPL